MGSQALSEPNDDFVWVDYSRCLLAMSAKSKSRNPKPPHTCQSINFVTPEKPSPTWKVFIVKKTPKRFEPWATEMASGLAADLRHRLDNESRCPRNSELHDLTKACTGFWHSFCSCASEAWFSNVVTEAGLSRWREPSEACPAPGLASWPPQWNSDLKHLKHRALHSNLVSRECPSEAALPKVSCQDAEG